MYKYATLTVELPCGCSDLYFYSVRIDREHDHVICNGIPLAAEEAYEAYLSEPRTEPDDTYEGS